MLNDCTGWGYVMCERCRAPTLQLKRKIVGNCRFAMDMYEIKHVSFEDSKLFHICS